MNDVVVARSPVPPPGSPMPHYVSEAPFDPRSIEKLTPDQERIYLASQWRLMWWKFRRHRLAVWSGAFLGLLYFSILLTEFLAPFPLNERHVDFIHMPPQRVHFFHEGQFIGPFVHGGEYKLDMDHLKRVYTVDKDKVFPIRFFCRSYSYKLFGVIPTDFHLFCPTENAPMFLLGTDRLGRDMLSRIIYGARVSLTIGLLGITVSFVLGIVIGGLAGYYGGVVDLVVQRIIEVLQSIPSIPLWLALAAIMPPTWSPLLVYFGITIILGLLDWTGLARAVRSKLLALREEDYVLAAQLMGANPPRIISPPHSGLHVAPHRHRHDRHTRDDPGRDGLELPRLRAPAADHQLGRAADRGAEHQRGCALPLVDVPSHSRHPRYPCFQLPG
jgi:peptide/nickel transport system permease protein